MAKSKTPVRDSDWALVPLIVVAEKRIDGTINDLIRRLTANLDPQRNANAGDWVHEHPVEYFGGTVAVRLRICGNLRSNIPESWTASILAFGVQIDGIDHHVKAPNGRGGKCRGWHRYEWNPSTRSCRDWRNEMPNFDPGESIGTFVLAVCERFRVILKEEGVEDDGLQLN